MKLIVLILSVYLTAHAEDVKKISLEESVEIAVKGATPVLKADRDDKVGSTQLLQSYLQFLPNLGAQGSYNYAKGTTYLTSAVPTLVDGSSHGPGYTISSTLNIFNGLADISSWNASRERKKSLDLNLFRVKQQISLDVAQSFLQVILDQRLVSIAEKNLKASQDREALLSEQTAVGLRNKSDLFRQQAQTSADESYLISNQNKKQNDVILFLRKLRISPDIAYELVEPPLEEQVATLDTTKQNFDEKEYVNRALDLRKDYEVSKLNAEAAHDDVLTIRSNYFPKLDFVASYTTSARYFDYQNISGANTAPAIQPGFNDQLSNQGAYVYGIVLTWNIFDRWSNSLNVERAKAVAYKSDLDKEDFRRQVIGEMKQAIDDYKTAVQQLISSQRGLVAAQKAYEVSEGRYEVGSATYVDMAIAQSALVQAEALRAQAVIGYELQKRSVDFALGVTKVPASL